MKDFVIRDREALFRVRQCTALLDELIPGWWYNIRDTAHTNSLFDCFLVQATGTGKYSNALKKIGLLWSEGPEFGVYVSGNSILYKLETYELLTFHWIEEVNERLEQNGFLPLWVLFEDADFKETLAA